MFLDLDRKFFQRKAGIVAPMTNKIINRYKEAARDIGSSLFLITKRGVPGGFGGLNFS